MSNERKASAECVFKPQTNVKKYRTKLLPDRQSSFDEKCKWHEREPMRNRKNMSPIDLEYEKQKSECTFKPVFFTKKKTPNKSKSPTGYYKAGPNVIKSGAISSP
jgi:hypothetical protein